ncbi:phage head spike fiber domain-containing protein [Aeromonas veronii]|uniref:phage head spike fiber domain-containing protein n=1 Tax=Aeromonas veronii TaxID=654 RepID=UPI003DA3A5A1
MESDTVLYLVTAYAGGSATGQAYSIVISITGQVPAFSRELSAFVAYHQGQMDGWQQLLTGTGDVTLTAPDGTKKTVPSWEKVMNAGYGVVAQAAAQAAIAKSEAEKASASASAAAGAVEAAALPIPDLWAPLTDDLRLITGHGHEVKVGDVVVARLLGISRDSSATVPGTDGLPVSVAANVPRFVNGWLLLEGMSTNFIPDGRDNTAWGVFRCTTTKTTVTPTDDTSAINVSLSLLKSGTMSAYFKRSETTGTRAFYHGRRLCDFKIKSDGTIDVISYGINASNAKAEVFGEYVRVSVSFSEYGENGCTQVYIEGANGVETFVSCVQLEPLPEATSYIPTDGAASTRAAESLSVRSDNLPDGDVTIAVEVGKVRSYSGYSAHVYRENGSFLWIRREGETNNVSRPGLLQIDLKSALGTCVHRVRRTGESPCVKLRVGTARGEAFNRLNPFTGQLVFGTQGGEQCFTKIRNIRIWRLYLTDEQDKAVI